MALPAEVSALVEFHPLEDLILALLRQHFSEVPVQTLVSSDQDFPLILIRRGDEWGSWEGDGFVTSGTLRVNTFAQGIDADQDAALLGEAVRNALARSLNVVIPGKGHLTKFKPLSLPARKPDWATATGPVQYADLPTGVVRYESVYDLAFRRSI